MKRFLQRTDEEIREAYNCLAWLAADMEDGTTPSDRLQKGCVGSLALAFAWLAGEEGGDFDDLLTRCRVAFCPPRG